AGFNILGRQRLQGALVVAEIAMTMMLLAGGGLLLRSFVHFLTVDPGYDPTRVLTFQASPPGGRPLAERRRFADDILERIREMPGVAAVGYGNNLPLVRQGFLRNSGPTPDILQWPNPGPETHAVSADFLNALGLRLVAGHGFTDPDGPRAAQSDEAIINRAMA